MLVHYSHSTPKTHNSWSASAISVTTSVSSSSAMKAAQVPFLARLNPNVTLFTTLRTIQPCHRSLPFQSRLCRGATRSQFRHTLLQVRCSTSLLRCMTKGLIDDVELRRCASRQYRPLGLLSPLLASSRWALIEIAYASF